MTGRTVIIAGATGLVGKEILRGLLADDSVTAVCSLGRRVPATQHPKLTSHVIDFAALPSLPTADEVYLALGTTIRAAGSQAAFRFIDYDANLAVARSALKAGAKRVGLVSAMGADASSRLFYSRVKGELEDALIRMPFEGIVMVRPSLLLGDRESIGQSVRPGERMASALAKAVGAFIPANYKPIHASAVARALLRYVPSANGRQILLSGSMRREFLSEARP